MSDREDVERALRAAESGSAGHWPTVAAVLRDEVMRLRSRPLAFSVDSKELAGDTVNPMDRATFILAANARGRYENGHELPVEKVAFESEARTDAGELRRAGLLADPALKAELAAARAEIVARQTEFEGLRAERDKLQARIDAALAVCAAGEHQATRWAQPFPVPNWVIDVRAALLGDQIAELSTPPGQCPHHPPCEHPAMAHDVSGDPEDPAPMCCAEGCQCGQVVGVVSPVPSTPEETP